MEFLFKVVEINTLKPFNKDEEIDGIPDFTVPAGYFVKNVTTINGALLFVMQKSKKTEKKDTYHEDQYLAVCKCLQTSGVKNMNNTLVNNAINGVEMSEFEKRLLVSKHRRWCKSSPKCY